MKLISQVCHANLRGVIPGDVLPPFLFTIFNSQAYMAEEKDRNQTKCKFTAITYYGQQMVRAKRQSLPVALHILTGPLSTRSNVCRIIEPHVVNLCLYACAKVQWSKSGQKGESADT
jgi:hypothetical protein